MASMPPLLDVRRAVIGLTRSQSLAPVTTGAALLAAAVSAILHGDGAAPFWALVLVVGAPACVSIAKDAKRRDDVVLARDDDIVRAYLCARLDRSISSTSRVALPVLALPFLLLGLVLLWSVPEYPAKPATAAQFLLVGGALLVTFLYRRFVVRHAMTRLRKDVGPAAPTDPPPRWLIDAAREVAGTLGTLHAALLWRDVTGSHMRAARAAVLALPNGSAAAKRDSATMAPAAPSPEAVRAGIRALARSDLRSGVFVVLVLLILTQLEDWATNGLPGLLWTNEPGHLTAAQIAYGLLAAVMVVGTFAQRATHRAALRGADAPMRTYLLGERTRRGASASRPSPASVSILGVALACIAWSTLATEGGVAPSGSERWTPRILEAAILLVWLILIPVVRARRARARLRLAASREDTGSGGTGE
jgi:hypothetical protein